MDGSEAVVDPQGQGAAGCRLAAPGAGVDAAEVVLAVEQVADPGGGGQQAAVVELELALDGGVPQPVGGQLADRGVGILGVAIGRIGVGAADVEAVEGVAPGFGEAVDTSPW